MPDSVNVASPHGDFEVTRPSSGQDRPALLFPGGRYSPEMPLLYYLPQILEQRGLGLWVSRRSYADLAGFGELSQEARASVVREDVSRVCGLAAPDSGDIGLLIGKSIGCRSVMAALDLLGHDAARRSVWLTPLLSDEDMLERIALQGSAAFVAIGTADPGYSHEAVSRLRAAGCSVLEPPLSDHGLEVPGRALRSVEILSDVLARVGLFLNAPSRAAAKSVDPCVVVKIGGSLLSPSDAQLGPDPEVVRPLAPVLRDHAGRVVLVHGLGRLGRSWMPLYGEGRTLPAGRAAIAARIQDAHRRFHSDLCASLTAAGLRVRSLDPHALFRLRGGERCAAHLALLPELLSAGEVPVLYGGTLPDDECGFSILSSDEIVLAVALHTRARRVAWLTDVPGVYGTARSDRPEGLLERIEDGDSTILSSLPGSRHDPTGGMARKVRVALQLSRAGISSRILAGSDPRAVRAAIEGSSGAGTDIRPTR